MFCPNCGTQRQPNAPACGRCGAWFQTDMPTGPTQSAIRQGMGIAIGFLIVLVLAPIVLFMLVYGIGR